MWRRFRPRTNSKRRFYPAVKSNNQDLMWAITAGRQLNATSNVTVKDPYIPEHKFEDFAIVPEIKRNIASKKYTSPTPIQDRAIPTILAGEDIIGVANTGTGKTAAFLIPLINKVFMDRSQKTLIITPTRELALQIYDELAQFSQGLAIRSALCIGGTSLFNQKRDLLQNPSFVIGTPGRIKDLIGQRCLNLSQFGNVVLDEVDRMVDIGFIDDIKYFISLLYGFGLGLAFDEFAFWLKLTDDDPARWSYDGFLIIAGFIFIIISAKRGLKLLKILWPFRGSY